MTRLRRFNIALAHLGCDEDGSSAVEFAIVGSVFLALCIAVLQFGLALHADNELAHAADRGVRLIVIDPEASDDTIESEVEELLPAYNADRLVVEVAAETVDSIEYRTISIDYQMQIAVPGLPVNLLTLNASRRIPLAS